MFSFVAPCYPNLSFFREKVNSFFFLQSNTAHCKRACADHSEKSQEKGGFSAGVERRAGSRQDHVRAGAGKRPRNQRKRLEPHLSYYQEIQNTRCKIQATKSLSH